VEEYVLLRKRNEMISGSHWRLLACVGAVSLAAGPVNAQSMEELLRRIEALQRRVEELEASQPTPRQAAARPPARATAPTQQIGRVSGRERV